MTSRHFKRDVDRAAADLHRATNKGFLWHVMRFFLLVDNTREVERAQRALHEAQADLDRYREIDADLVDVREQLDELITLGGVRVVERTFVDLNEDGTATYPPNWQELRLEVLARDGYGCQEADCDCHGPLHIHHKRPLSKGGGNQMSNLVTLCAYHHARYHPNNPKMRRWLRRMG